MQLCYITSKHDSSVSRCFADQNLLDISGFGQILNSGTPGENMIQSLYEGSEVMVCKCKGCGFQSEREEIFRDLNLNITGVAGVCFLSLLFLKNLPSMKSCPIVVVCCLFAFVAIIYQIYFVPVIGRRGSMY